MKYAPGHIIVKNDPLQSNGSFLLLNIFEENISWAKPISYDVSRISPI